MIYEFDVKEPYKTFLLNGQKIIEGRLNRGKFKRLKVGDILKFKSGEKFKVIRKTKYNSFFEMLRLEGIKNVLPDKNDILDGVKVYYQFYSPEEEKKFGVLAIELKLLES